jgi:tryptophan 2,3-dioxygenase
MDFGRDGNPFANYVSSDVLLSLQRPGSQSAAEPAFMIMTQVMELLFKLVHTECLRARDLLENDDVAATLWTLRRLRYVCSVLISAWGVLGTLSPTEYGEFRDQFGQGSGFQSSMYRQLEFLLGNKDRAMAEAHRGEQAAYRDLVRTLTEPSLYDAALRLLWRRGLPVPKSAVDRDWSRPYQEEDGIVAAWRTVYLERDRYGDLYLMAEALTDLAYDLGRWRSTHVLTAERMLGSKMGTGGTSGVNWLRRVAEQRFFPELWTVRSLL